MPREKPYEELLIGDNVSGTDHQGIMRAQEKSLTWKVTKELQNQLDSTCNDYHCEKIKAFLFEAPTEFKLSSPLADSVWIFEQKNKSSSNVVNL